MRSGYAEICVGPVTGLVIRLACSSMLKIRSGEKGRTDIQDVQMTTHIYIIFSSPIAGYQYLLLIYKSHVGTMKWLPDSTEFSILFIL